MATGISGTGTSSSARLCCRSRPQEAREQRAREREMPFLANQSHSSKRRGARRGWTRHVRYSCTPVVFGVDTYLGARPRRGSCAQFRARTRDRLGVVTRRRAPPVRATAGAAEGSGPCGAARATGPALVWRGRHALSPVCINRRRRSAHRSGSGCRVPGARGAMARPRGPPAPRRGRRRVRPGSDPAGSQPGPLRYGGPRGR